MFSVRRLSPEAFVSDVVPTLAEREVENNLMIGLAYRLCASPDLAQNALIAVVEADGVPVGAALRTPPHFVATSALPEGAAAALVDALADQGLDGASGPGEAGREVALRLAARHSARVELMSDEVLYELTRVSSPPRPSGAARLATSDDVPLVRTLYAAFFAELRLPHFGDPAGLATRSVSEQRALLWDDAGVKALACKSRQLVTGAAIAPVYTLPEARGRGYASALTAELAQSLLDAGRRFVCLHADRKNRTSNHIYQSIGFRPVGDFRVWAVR